MSRVIPNYSKELLKSELAPSLSIADFITGIRQRLTDQTYFHYYTDTHADNAIPKDFIYKEVFRP